MPLACSKSSVAWAAREYCFVKRTARESDVTSSLRNTALQLFSPPTHGSSEYYPRRLGVLDGCPRAAARPFLSLPRVALRVWQARPHARRATKTSVWCSSRRTTAHRPTDRHPWGPDCSIPETQSLAWQ